MKSVMDSVIKVLEKQVSECVKLATKAELLKTEVSEEWSKLPMQYGERYPSSAMYECSRKKFLDLKEDFNKWYYYCKTFLEENNIPESFITNIATSKRYIDQHIDKLINDCIKKQGYKGFDELLLWLNKSILTIKGDLLSVKSTLLAKKDSFLFSLRFDVVEDIFQLALRIGDSEGIPKPAKIIASGALLRVAIERASNIELERKGEKIPSKFQAKTQKLKELGSLTDFQFKEINEVYGKLCTPSHAQNLDEKEYERLMNSATHILDNLKSRV